MDLPKELALQAVAEDIGDLSGLIFGMRITTGRKNPYHIYFPKTDQLGRSTLARHDIEGQFADHWASALMDHSGTIQEASQETVFYLFAPEAMRRNIGLISAWGLLPHEATIWRTRRDVTEYFLSCRNEQFSCSDTARVIPVTGEVSLTVRRLQKV
jgi:hypothetical protein